MNSIKPKIAPDEAFFNQKVEELKRFANNPKKLKEAAEEFESLFVNYMLKSMRKTVMKSELLGSGLGGDIMESMFDEKLSQNLASHSNLGIAELVYQQLSDQETTNAVKNVHLNNMPLFRSNKTKKAAISNYQATQFQSKLKPFENHIREAAKAHKVESALIQAVIAAESGGNPNAESPKNAKGLMQLIDSTAAEMGVKNPFNPQDNIQGGTKYLAKLLDKFNGNYRLALAAYNAGPTAVEKYNDIPPYDETRNYVDKVLSYLKQFKIPGM